MPSAIRRILAFAVLTGVPVIAAAQVIPPSEQPGRERERFEVPRPPLVRPEAPVITLPSTVAPPGAEKVRIIIRRVQIVGSTVYRPEDFRPLYADLIGRQVPLTVVYDLARRITAKYGADGYVLSRAIVPPQQFDPKGATVRIEVIEGYINKVIWPTQIARYRNFFTEYAAKITRERPVNIRTIERYLLLASDLPGLKFTTTLQPSETEPGAAALLVEVTEKPLEAFGRVDNRGTKSRGPFQFLASGTLNNLLGQHEAFTIGYAGVSPLRELQYVAPGWRQVLNSEGLTAFVNGTYSWGFPGTPTLQLLQFYAQSTIIDGGLSYPFIRSRERNLIVSGVVFMSDNASDILGAPFNRDRLRGFRIKGDADLADQWQGINQFNVTFSQGIEGLGSTQNGNPLASRAAGRVDFSKLEGTVSRIQPLVASISAYVAAYGQYGFTSLLVSEQCGYGGRFFGRAFDPSQLLADRCIELVGELRYDLPAPAGSPLSQAQLYGFTDKGWLHTITPAVGTPQRVEAASAGGGLRLGWLQYGTADLTVAKGIEGPRHDWRFFFAVTVRN
ncbi:MAG TPA: POTRA domain-containing protein [Xanthobacteraceae bacterium]|nr:POTRA domain-containing protein [Xanthobacteraceae bacterium]